MRIITIAGAALAGVAFAIWSAGADAANPRIALVIGESAYSDATLPTAANDAGLVAQVLQAAGYDVVGARDLDQKSVRESLRDFLDKANAAGPDMQAFVYFSGRALQYSGDNYLAPVDARIARDSDAPIEAIKLTDFTHALAQAPGLARVIVIDGARPNPYAQQGQPLAGGLALIDPEPGEVVAFNAAPGAIGVEDAGDYGVYAKALTGLMRQGGVDINDVLAQVRLKVNQDTQGAQIPWSAGKLDAPYFLFERAPDAPPPVAKRAPAKKPLKQLSAAEAYQVVVERDRLEDYEEFMRDHARSEQARRIEAILAARREALFWRRALEQNSPRAYWTYLRRYPKGPHAYDAGRRLDLLAARREPPPDFAVLDYDDLPPPPPREAEYADRPVYYFGGDDYGPPPEFVRDYGYDDQDDRDWRDLPPPPRPTVAGMLPALAIAIPLGVAARAYYGRPDRDGRAPANAAPPPPRPPGPPPLPQNVKVIERPEVAPPPRPAAAPGAAGQVRFAAPQPAVGGRPPTPAATPAAVQVSPTPAATRTPEPGRTPKAEQTPLPTPSASPTPTGAATPEPSHSPKAERTPLPTPSATPSPAGAATPEPSHSPKAERTPLPTPSPAGAATPQPSHSPKAERTPLPTPSATPTPASAATPQPSQSPKAERTPLPTPAATPEPTHTPKAERTPLPSPSATPAPAHSPKAERTALPTPEPSPSHTPHAARTATPESETPAEAKPAHERPKPEAQHTAVPEPKPAETKAHSPEAPKASPRSEAEPKTKTAEEPKHKAAEEPKPKAAEAPARRAVEETPAHAEAPRTAAPHPEAKGETPHAKEANCGHPGQPRC